jgi:mRNA interferase MazF
MSVADPRQGEIYWASLDPTVGREIAKRRPVLIVSPDDMNRNLLTVIAAPVTTTIREWPTRYVIHLRGKPRSVALDQIRCLSVARLSRRITSVDPRPALDILQRTFTL